MNGKLVLIGFCVMMFSACNFNEKPPLKSQVCPPQVAPQACLTQVLPQTCPTQAPDQSVTSMEDLKKYLIEKKITVETIEQVKGAEGIYEVNKKSGIFYIDQNKKIIFGMIINLETGANITLDKPVWLTGGRLLPFATNGMNSDRNAPVILDKIPPSGLSLDVATPK